MAQPLSLLQSNLKALEGVEDVYIQGPGPQTMVYPCIRIARNDSFVAFADNLQYLFKKRYSITVIDRQPDSPIPDLVEALPHTRFDRFYVANGLNHFVFNLYF
jgi:hypothetical protein